MRVLWLTPDKLANISVGRSRIATHLRDAGLDVTVQGTVRQTIQQAFWNRREYDVIVGTTRAGAIAGTGLTLMGGPPLIVDHVDPIRQFETTASRPLALGVRVGEAIAFRVADHVLYVYEEERGRVERHAKASTQTALGVDFDRFADPDESAVEASRQALAKFEPRDQRAVYIGGLEPLYNVDELIAVADCLENWSIVIAGSGSLEADVRDAADGRNLIYLGTLDHTVVPGLLALCDVGLSLVNDPHTLKTLEYGAAGLPVVQLMGRAKARFGDRVTYCSPEPASVAKAIERANEQNPDSLHDFVHQFDWAEIADTYREVIEAVARPSQP